MLYISNILPGHLDVSMRWSGSMGRGMEFTGIDGRGKEAVFDCRSQERPV